MSLYQPNIPTETVNDVPSLKTWLLHELRMIAQRQRESNDRLKLKVTRAAPSKFNDGDIFEADGTNWNPGAGAGLYIRRAGAWARIG